MKTAGTWEKTISVSEEVAWGASAAGDASLEFASVEAVGAGSSEEASGVV